MGCYVKNDRNRIRKNIRYWQVLIYWIRIKRRISYIAKRYAKANNEYINDYEPKKPSTFIPYLEMSNLYGWPMSEYRPYKGLRLLQNIDKYDIIKVQ